MPTNRPDNPDSDYDLIIIGGGCSGLSLAAALCRLAVQPEHVPRTLIVEPRSRYTNDRSWCFWAQADHNNQGPAGKPWQSSSRHGCRSDRQVLAVLGIQCRVRKPPARFRRGLELSLCPLDSVL